MGRKCKTCGTWFLFTDPWVWLLGHGKMCSWDCIDAQSYDLLMRSVGFPAEDEAA